MIIRWAFLDRKMVVHNLVDPRVAYSWTCGHDDHKHTIDCLWIWHKCSAELLDPEAANLGYRGWQPTGVGLHTLVSADPLHLEASMYWPECCGLHGFIREGRWLPV